MTDKKKSEIIFEAPSVAVPTKAMAMVDAMMEAAEQKAIRDNAAINTLLEEPLEIFFSVQNNRVRFSVKDVGDARGALAKMIIKAVQSYDVKPIEKATEVRPSSGALGETKSISYERYVLLDWAKQTIFTSFPPDEGTAFLGAMAILVEEFQGKTIELPKGEVS